MNKKEYKIHIIGAGVSGLIAARVLEDNGYAPIVIEASDRVGGRLKTDIISDFYLDHGFQVLLTAYPAVQKYLDFEALDLQLFLPGASIFKNKKQKVIGDPIKDLSLLFPTLFSGIGNFTDKLKILRLNKQLKKKSISNIFIEKEQTTYSYLLDFGFSNEIITEFFKPFFSGIFLETKLETSSRMFEFIYKMFGEGSAAIPKYGIGEVPKQLFQNLNNTKFIFNRKVTSVNDREIILDDTTVLESDFTIIATESSDLISNLKLQPAEWNSCYTLYFVTQSRVISKRLIGLVHKEGALINNFFYHTSLNLSLKPVEELLSVTVIDKQNLGDKALIERVKAELNEICGIDDVVRFIKYYNLPKSLPKLSNLKYEVLPSETGLTKSLFLAGDTQLNGSLNAAMISGERAALGVVETISNTVC
jgi:protoporphyrinogen oxidase